MIEFGSVVWLTGIPASGKTTIATQLASRLRNLGLVVVTLDGDDLRTGLCIDLGYDKRDREENVRRAGCVAELISRSGATVICSLISPYVSSRRWARDLLPAGRFIEVYVRCPLTVCQQRDPKGLYRLHRSGKINGLTGIDALYEAPSSPEIIVDSDSTTSTEAAHEIERFMLNL